MLRFKSLRLAGFKSFVEGADLGIELGLTGVVGPNGCGKSNLVEALRWVMGETSAKKMRGGEMDDVIFGGTRDRPPRNIAEVILSLDNSARVAPAQFNDFDELEVSRRIERDKGSTYRINGHEVRARDVQLLFADSATGARSTAMVSQGRIGTVIAAKPVERRLLLEEAAGITGLHSRRHEAELRLRGADTNLERLDDIMVTLEAQLAHLKKQARQATRYRNLSDHIRKAEATLFFLRWTADEEALETASKALTKMGAVVTGLTGAASAAATAQAEYAAELPAKRQAEAEAAAELQRLTVARDGLEAEELRIKTASADCRVRLDETAADHQREQALVADGDDALKRLAKEKSRFDTPPEGEENARAEAAQDLADANAQVEELDDKLTGLTAEVANDEARRDGLALKIEDLKTRKERLAARGRDIAEQRRRLETEVPDAAALAEADRRFKQARTKLEQSQADADAAEHARTEAVGKTNATVAGSHAAAASTTRLEAEVEALAEILDAGDDDKWPPLIDTLGVEPGYEAALGVALGEDLTASDDEAAPSHWRALKPLTSPPALPSGVRPLGDFIRGPAVLDRRLAQIGVVDSEADGRRLAADLAQGQRLVSRDGALWRWDGFTVSTNAATASQARLDQRKRLNAAREKLAEAKAAGKVAEDRLTAVRQTEKDAIEAAGTAREAWAAADKAYGEARDALTEAKERSAGHDSHLTLLGDQASTIEGDLEHLEADDKEARDALDAIPDPTAKRQQIEEIRAELGQRRSHQVECQSHHDSLEKVEEERRQRFADIEAETASWQERRDAAEAQIGLLDERRQALEAELERFASRPAEIAEQRGSLLSAIEKAETNRKGLADRLAEAESALSKADSGLRAAEAELAEARENMVRAEGASEQAKQACHALAERIKDRLECRPDQLFEFSGLKPDADLPDLEAIERKVERLNRERETMGPVNLRADQEATELKEQIETMGTEREDLLKAIDKLRRGISELNREGRQRLLASFEEVNIHFQKLFERLFAGGRAYLELTESDDPLEAGLEIMASPPGKRLQVLSLLSGGEQALTALALLFAVFQTNPAPICVLDEVDAPLDDANVDRFCSLLEGMAKTDETRFLIITHHRMTMARMDRLFGVTMAERGVSQLVSVDLQRAEELRATA